MYLRSGEEKVRLLLNLDSLLDLHILFLTKYVYVKWNKAEPVKWGKCGFSSCLQNRQQTVSPKPRGLFPLPGHLCWRFVQICLMHLSFSSSTWWACSARSYWDVWDGSSQAKIKGKTGQKMWTGWGMWGGESRADPHVWGWETLASPQWPANEWIWVNGPLKERL